jgi:hypothetical protein
MDRNSSWEAGSFSAGEVISQCLGYGMDDMGFEFGQRKCIFSSPDI